MKASVFTIKVTKKIHDRSVQIVDRISGRGTKGTRLYEADVRYFDQAANDYVRSRLEGGGPLMVAKFGTIELFALSNWHNLSKSHYSLADCLDYIKGDSGALWWNTGVESLCHNAGFFPNDPNLLGDFFKVYASTASEVDILGSYLKFERVFSNELRNATRVNLDGYYAPYFYSNPWTGFLKGKRVLVVHPFEDSIKSQYANRQLLWKNPDVLPEFELITIKAEQTIAGQPSRFSNWFEALASMEDKISKADFDVALIGCGAYGMPLAAHVKRMGKQAVHLAGWLQVLFGINGQRWRSDPRFTQFINDAWQSPLPHEIPSGFKKVENGCYW
jgi:hypothetical protein